ncbi:Fe-S cluster assembly sulfur transfer protein SufU [Lactovum miscens]|uniref:Nitrogen fixation NifU-like protein n=1 Tax=Lactovum miscens TaxID=190387 RepID=A0A841C754_9LACT|nr:SUF system NifU family Fe-S cluster assembly protein [Lactovum miscens]MBB5888174.1 nitrogen fixation NifU-like protein [Lactovum miscens]
MALSKLNELYGSKFEQMAIRDHADHPRNAGKLQVGCVVDLNNPTCGDVIRLTVNLEENKVKDIAFSGHGCTISTASASMMTEVVLGKSKEEVLELADLFSKMVTGQEELDLDNLGDALFLKGVAKFPQRVKCSTLPWNALKKALEVGSANLSETHE